MPVKKLHISSKIFFPNPYVVRVQYGTDISFDESSRRYRETTRRAYKLIQGTWGYSSLLYENVKLGKGEQPSPQPLAGFNGLNQQVILSSLFDSDFATIPRGYLCFKDEGDALQFRLSVDTTSRQVFMWPSTEFTIHEYIEEHES